MMESFSPPAALVLMNERTPPPVARIKWKEIWKSGSKIWKAKKSGTVGRPTVPDFSQKDKKEAM
jgi:hypothetical protein